MALTMESKEVKAVYIMNWIHTPANKHRRF